MRSDWALGSFERRLLWSWSQDTVPGSEEGPRPHAPSKVYPGLEVRLGCTWLPEADSSQTRSLPLPHSPAPPSSQLENASSRRTEVSPAPTGIVWGRHGPLPVSATHWKTSLPPASAVNPGAQTQHRDPSLVKQPGGYAWPVWPSG